VTNEIINLLFEGGQTLTRRAMRDLYYATSGNPRVNPTFQQVVNRAVDAMTAGDEASSQPSRQSLPPHPMIATSAALRVQRCAA
jgi:hypothetical protein